GPRAARAPGHEPQPIIRPQTFRLAVLFMGFGDLDIEQRRLTRQAAGGDAQVLTAAPPALWIIEQREAELLGVRMVEIGWRLTGGNGGVVIRLRQLAVEQAFHFP